jgi:RNA-directed DNA polymerase
MTTPTLKTQIRSRLDLFSIERFQKLLRTPIEEIEAIANKAGSYYSPFNAPPPRRWFPKVTRIEKIRKIDNPIEPLKALQRKILSNLLETIYVPSYMLGGVKGRTLRQNIEIHASAKVLVTLDIKSFFRSVTSQQVFRIWRKSLNCSKKTADLLTKLTTFEGHLPQGAPTSTYLANLVLASVDKRILDACEREGVTFSTWVDDLAFSGSNAPNVINAAVMALKEVGLAVSHHKLKVMRAGTRKQLNGLVLSRTLNLPSAYRKGIRSGIFKLRTKKICKAILPTYVRSLNGRIEYISSVNEKVGDRLKRDFIDALQTLGMTLR